MLIVAGYLVVDPLQRDSYLEDCRAVVRQARTSPGCLDFAISADLIEPGRIDIFERWESRVALDEFRKDRLSRRRCASTTWAASGS
jgi:quinol monooxygenase YgiN